MNSYGAAHSSFIPYLSTAISKAPKFSDVAMISNALLPQCGGNRGRKKSLLSRLLSQSDGHVSRRAGGRELYRREKKRNKVDLLSGEQASGG